MNKYNQDMKPEPQREEALFALAVDKSPADRAAFLERECGGDAALRQRIAALLAAHDRKDAPLEPEAPKPDREPVKTLKLEIADPPDEAVGQTLGQDVVWQNLGMPYVVTDDLTIPAGRTLTIAAGVVVKPWGAMR